MKKYFLILIMAIICLAACGQGNTSVNGITEYTVDNVLEKCGLAGCDEFSEDGNTFYYQLIENEDGCTKIIIIDWENPYSGYRFYIYPTKGKAKKELTRRKKNYFEADGMVVGANYAGGWEAGLMDASKKVFDYQSLNMIVEVDDESTSADMWADESFAEEYNSDEAKKAREEYAEILHEKVMSEW